MKSFFSALFMFTIRFGFAQIPTDSLYLGQTPPGNTPKIFNLSVSSGTFAAERIAISDDGTQIYYSEVKGYYPTNSPKIRNYSFADGKWNASSVLFDGYNAVSLSVTQDTMYFEGVNFATFYSVKNGSEWSNPKQFLTNLNAPHYFQVTDNGNQYVSTIPQNGIGNSDWCKLSVNGADTAALSLGLPLNSGVADLDFFVSKDETFMILAKSSVLSISYLKNDGTWTNPKNLGTTINFGLGEWGPYVTNDKKYLFYTTGTKGDYSDTHVYWVRIDTKIDSLKYTNSIPYLKNKINNQIDSVGHSYTFTVPDSTFIDDDGNNTLTYSATLSNGAALPSWLNFDPATKTFTGTPTATANIFVKVKATDTTNVFAYSVFNLKINAATSVNQTFEQNIRIFPNPVKDNLNISFGSISYKDAAVNITDICGKSIFSNRFQNISNTTINLSDKKKGIYFIYLNIDNEIITKKICLN
jgi:hypothetical protein